MTGPGHYREAERLGSLAQGQDLIWAMFTMAQAQMHATLALAAATALNDCINDSGDGGLPRDDWKAWKDAAGTPGDGT